MILGIIFLISICKSQSILYDSNTFKEFNIENDPNFQCFNGAIFNGLITFSGTFFQIPQIVIAMLAQKYDRNVQFSFNILQITTLNCTFQIQCFSTTAKLYKQLKKSIIISIGKVQRIKFNFSLNY